MCQDNRMAASKNLLTFAEFERLSDEPGKLELLDGELIRLPPVKFDHATIAEILYQILVGAVATSGDSCPVGKAHIECGYKLGPNAWLIPDVSIQHKGQPRGDYLEGAPALAVEIISESNRAEDMDRKVKKYLSTGGIEVWVVYPKTQSVWVHRPGFAEEFHGELRSDIIPGLKISLTELFTPAV